MKGQGFFSVLFYYSLFWLILLNVFLSWAYQAKYIWIYCSSLLE